MSARSRRGARSSRRTPGKPSGPMDLRSPPEPFTRITRTRRPAWSASTRLTEVFPPPWRTRDSSAPRSLENRTRASNSFPSGAISGALPDPAHRVLEEAQAAGRSRGPRARRGARVVPGEDVPLRVGHEAEDAARGVADARDVAGRPVGIGGVGPGGGPGGHAVADHDLPGRLDAGEQGG